MKQFLIELLKPKNAILNAKIFKNDFLKIPATLFYNIEIDLTEIEYQKQIINTAIHLDFIKLDIYKLSELENQVFEFPINPEKGFIEGSIYLLHVHNPIDVKKIEFSKIENNSIKATLYFDIIFEYENTGFADVKDCTLKINLSLGQLSIDNDIMNSENFNAIKAGQLVSKFVFLDDYEKSHLNESHAVFKMKIIE